MEKYAGVLLVKLNIPHSNKMSANLIINLVLVMQM